MQHFVLYCQNSITINYHLLGVGSFERQLDIYLLLIESERMKINENISLIPIVITTSVITFLSLVATMTRIFPSHLHSIRHP